MFIGFIFSCNIYVIFNVFNICLETDTSCKYHFQFSSFSLFCAVIQRCCLRITIDLRIFNVLLIFFFFFFFPNRIDSINFLLICNINCSIISFFLHKSWFTWKIKKKNRILTTLKRKTLINYLEYNHCI